MDRYDPYTDKFISDVVDTNVGDMISRKQAIDALHTWFKDGFDEDKWWNSTHVLAAIECLPPVTPKQPELSEEDRRLLKKLRSFHNGSYAKVIDRLMSAQPEQRTGKWILVTDNNGQHFVCNKCGTWRHNQGQKFCGECGAKMT